MRNKTGARPIAYNGMFGHVQILLIQVTAIISIILWVINAILFSATFRHIPFGCGSCEAAGRQKLRVSVMSLNTGVKFRCLNHRFDCDMLHDQTPLEQKLNVVFCICRTGDHWITSTASIPVYSTAKRTSYRVTAQWFLFFACFRFVSCHLLAEYSLL